MISNLAKFVISGNEKYRPLLNLLKLFAHQATQEYLKKAITKNMEKIIEIVIYYYYIKKY